jgi:hypothetical protein
VHWLSLWCTARGRTESLLGRSQSALCLRAPKKLAWPRQLQWRCSPGITTGSAGRWTKSGMRGQVGSILQVTVKRDFCYPGILRELSYWLAGCAGYVGLYIPAWI